MGATAARHARDVLDNVERILAIELLVGAQALDLRRAAVATVLAAPAGGARRRRPGRWRARRPAGGAPAPGAGVAAAHRRIRAVIAPAGCRPRDGRRHRRRHAARANGGARRPRRRLTPARRGPHGAGVPRGGRRPRPCRRVRPGSAPGAHPGPVDPVRDAGGAEGRRRPADHRPADRHSHHGARRGRCRDRRAASWGRSPWPGRPSSPISGSSRSAPPACRPGARTRPRGHGRAARS